MVNHHTPFRVANLFDLGWLADGGSKKKTLPSSPTHQSPSVKPQTLDPQLSLQLLQVQGAGRMVNHHTPFRVANLFNLGWLTDGGFKKKNLFRSIPIFRFRVATSI